MCMIIYNVKAMIIAGGFPDYKQNFFFYSFWVNCLFTELGFINSGQWTKSGLPNVLYDTQTKNDFYTSKLREGKSQKNKVSCLLSFIGTRSPSFI